MVKAQNKPWGIGVDILFFAGTRPEIIKLAPDLSAARASGLDGCWVATGQHAALADDTYRALEFEPTIRLELDWDGQALTSLTSALIKEAGSLVERLRPRAIIVQGDTATAYAGAMAGFLNRIPVCHVEAGLRTPSLASPFPEEGFRRLIARIASLHFTPTRGATRNLIKEGTDPQMIIQTGNTVVDAVLSMAQRVIMPASLKDKVDPDRAFILVTAHRRENWDAGMDDICRAILELRDRHKGIQLVLPVHSNPRVADRIHALLDGQDNIHLVPALPYREFVWALQNCTLVLTDSGGVQEEATTLGKPILIMRDSTERQEAVEIGAARLVGSKASDIVSNATSILRNPILRWMMTRKKNPFGDGRASQRIANALADLLQ